MLDMFRQLDSLWRRFLTLFVDIFYASLTIYLTADGSTMMWLLYVLLSIGYGARYGALYSYIAVILILLHYNLLLQFTDLWSRIPMDLAAQMLILFFLPFYLNSLFKRLHMAKEEAEQLNGLKSKFLASMTHEIRTPLNGIIGTARLMEGTHLNPLQQKYHSALSYSTQILHELIDDILDFSKIEADKLELNIVTFDLHQSVNQIVECLKPKTTQIQQELVANIESAVPRYINGDKQRLQQILVNLIGNGLKNSDPTSGKVTLNISLHSEKKEENYHNIRFSIRDNGIGIDKEKQRTIFDNYTQLNHQQLPGNRESDYLRPIGTGLGMAIVKELVELMGGNIQLHSKLGKGSTFYFTLPLEKAINPPIQEHTSNDGDQNNESLQILVAEDDEINAMVSEQFLKDLGHSVKLVRDGKQALHCLQQGNYDMVFMDMHMPHATGIEVTSVYRRQNQYTPIIGLTANATTEHRDACLAAGMSDFLSKPITPEKLSATINKNRLITEY